VGLVWNCQLYLINSHLTIIVLFPADVSWWSAGIVETAEGMMVAIYYLMVSLYDNNFRGWQMKE
jgi:hypothetical protein